MTIDMRALALDDLTNKRDDLKKAFDDCAGRHPVITGLQALALLHLLNDGTCKGTTLPKSDPPRRVMVVGYGDLAPMSSPGTERMDLFTGESVYKEGEDTSFVPHDEGPDYQTLIVVADDGRSWTLVGMGICWPDWWSVQSMMGIDPVQA